MSVALEDYALPIHCPKCGANIQKTTSWLRGNNKLECPCGTTMHLEPEEVLQAVEALEAALRRIVRPTPGAEKVPA
jgi:hypothetical protein